MFLDVLQNRWLILTMLGGPALILALVLSYLALWRARSPENQPGAESWTFRAWLMFTFPWVLALTYVGLAVYIVVYTLAQSAYPPNW